MNGRPFRLQILAELRRRHGGAVDAVASGLGADIDHRIADAGGRRIENLVGPRDADGHRIDQNVAVIARMEIALAADRRHPHAVAVAADAGDDAGDEMPRFGMIRGTEAQRVQIGDRPRAHGEDVAQNAADAGRGTLIGLDERRMVVQLHLEDGGLPIADIDHAGILARAADHARSRGRQAAQPFARRFVGAMLAPHHRENAELGQARLAPHDFYGAGVFVGREAVLGDDLRRNHASASAMPLKKPMPSVLPRSASVASSGCGIRPSTRRRSSKIPAMLRIEPL